MGRRKRLCGVRVNLTEPAEIFFICIFINWKCFPEVIRVHSKLRETCLCLDRAFLNQDFTFVVFLSYLLKCVSTLDLLFVRKGT